MPEINTYKCWLGQEQQFVTEVNKLLELLQTQILTGKKNLILSPGVAPNFNWIGDSSYNVYESHNEFMTGGYLALQTSGTTASPKTIWHNSLSLLNNKKGKGSEKDKWLLTYNPGRWAGLSVLLHVLKTQAQLIIPEDLTLTPLITALPQATHVSLTPSLFRKLLLFAGDKLSSAPIIQVTLGGEYATQKVLDDVKAIWPQATVTHIYATTELGDICSCSDGLEGIPVSKLNRNLKYRFCLSNNKQLTIDEGELILFEGERMNKTGDIWRMEGDRLYFKGRVSEIINVGGAKVTSSTVENAVNSLEGIMECWAYALENVLLGQVVGLDYVGNIAPMELRKKLLSILPKYAVPVRLNQVDQITLTAAGKISRKI